MLNYFNFFAQRLPTINDTFFAFFKVSYVAAGFYRAGPKPISSSPELTKEWLKNSWNYYKHLKETIPQQETGIVDVSSKMPHTRMNFVSIEI